MNIQDSKPRRRPGKASAALPMVVAVLSAVALVLILSCCAIMLLPRLMTAPASPTLPSPARADLQCLAGVPQSAIANPDREVRGMYIATVQNINYPSKPGIPADALREELDAIVETCADANLNAIYFQVRPSADALYASDLFPVSAYLTGKQGADLPDGFDPLAYLIDIAHARGIEVHAWVNPLRVTVGSASKPEHDVSALAENHPARRHPDWVIPYADGRLYFDCGNPDVRALIAEGVRELAADYAIDGVIFDDYFYPYPVTSGKTTAKFNDDATFKQYGGNMKLADWRRENVNMMVKACYEAIKSVNSRCEFGIAPFGIWQNDDGKNGGSETSGFESYESLYCDPLAWVDGGYIDYLAPQIYWRFSTTTARYDTLVRWWNARLEGTGVKLLVSHGIYNYETWENCENELRNQVVFARAESAYRGSILYGYAAMLKNPQGLQDEVREVFAEQIIHTDTVSNGRELIISIPYSGSYIDGDGTFVIGTSDPTKPLTIDGAPVSRTKSGYFSAYLKLKRGKNTFTFEHDGKKMEYVIHRGTQPVTQGKITYPTLSGPEIAAVTPSSGWLGSGTLKVSVTAPKGAVVTAELNGKRISLAATIFSPTTSSYMKEVYTGSFQLSTAAGTVKDLGTIKFTSRFNGKTYTAESGTIRVAGSGASIPVEVLGDDTEMKIRTNSWYYDDYTPQSAGMRDNAVSLADGFWKLRCGGYIAEHQVKLLDSAPLGIASLTSAEVTREDGFTAIRIGVNEHVPVNCYIENGEFCVTVYNVDTKTAPAVTLGKNPMFTAVRGEKSAKANAYKYWFKLAAVENFYGFDHDYEDGYLVVRLREPQVLPDSDKPLAGKTIILDAGHGGKNPGALGPLGAAEGALNESDFNLEIVMAAQPYLEALGAEVIQIRDRACEIDVPIADRMQTLIDVQPDVMVSIHQNSMPYTTDITKVRGLVGLYWADSGYMLTDVMGEVMSNALGKLDRSPTKQRLAMVRNPKFPATLVETCFITSVEEYEIMMQPDTIDIIARSIADGVLAYYEAQRKYLD